MSQNSQLTPTSELEGTIFYKSKKWGTKSHSSSSPRKHGWGECSQEPTKPSNDSSAPAPGQAFFPRGLPAPCPRWAPWCFPVLNPAVPRLGQDPRLGKGIHFPGTLLCVREGAPSETFMARIVWLSDRQVWILALLLSNPVTWVS